jgi:hypothetical protein
MVSSVCGCARVKCGSVVSVCRHMLCMFVPVDVLVRGQRGAVRVNGCGVLCMIDSVACRGKPGTLSLCQKKALQGRGGHFRQRRRQRDPL